MIVQVPTAVIPIWFIEKWKKEEAKPDSALDYYINQLLHDWKIEELRMRKNN